MGEKRIVLKSARTFLSCPAASKACSLPQAERSTKNQDLANFVIIGFSGTERQTAAVGKMERKG